jgi:hypothetical protein
VEPAAAAAQVAARRLAVAALATIAAACATRDPAAGADDGIRRVWSLPAPASAPLPAAAVVGSAAEWATLAAAWGLATAALPAGACDFTVDRCLFVALPDAAAVAPIWGTEEGVDVLVLSAGPAVAPAPTLRAFVLPRRPAQLAVVLRPAAGAERVLWIDPAR